VCRPESGDPTWRPPRRGKPDGLSDEAAVWDQDLAWRETAVSDSDGSMGILVELHEDAGCQQVALVSVAGEPRQDRRELERAVAQRMAQQAVPPVYTPEAGAGPDHVEAYALRAVPAALPRYATGAERGSAVRSLRLGRVLTLPAGNEETATVRLPVGLPHGVVGCRNRRAVRRSTSWDCPPWRPGTTPTCPPRWTCG
jgi:hypothetical protein